MEFCYYSREVLKRNVGYKLWRVDVRKIVNLIEKNRSSMNFQVLSISAFWAAATTKYFSAPFLTERRQMELKNRDNIHLGMYFNILQSKLD